MTYTFHHEAMQAPFEVHIAGQREDYARQAADAVFREVDNLEDNLTRFSDYSDLARIGLLGPGRSVQVAPSTMQCLLVALWAYRETGGAFDVTLGRGMDRLTLDPATLSVTVGGESGGLELDLGGIGKGYALDNAADIIAHWGIGSAMLTAGPSTILAIGSPGEHPWSVGLNGTPLALRDEAVSASGKDVQGAHVLDPRRGGPATGHEKAWAVCPSAALADALSTAFMVMDSAAVERFCRTHEGVRGHVLGRDGALMSFG